VTIPGDWLHEYVTANNMGASLAMLVGRLPMYQENLEAALELSLEAMWLFQRHPLPESLETRILSSLDALDGELLVRASGPGCGPSGVELRSAGTRAELLSGIRSAWSRAFAPGAGRVPTWPEVSVVQRATLPASELSLVDRWREHLPGGEVLDLAPLDLSLRLEAAAAGIGTTTLPVVAAYARYALGCRYNSALAPDDPFEFLELLLPGSKTAVALRDRYYRIEQTIGRTEGQAWTKLAERSLELEWKLVEREHNQTGSTKTMGSRIQDAPDDVVPASRKAALVAQQLTGSSSSPGCASGVLHWVSGGEMLSSLPSSDATVLVCERFDKTLLALRPIAVIERGGGTLGAGALLARTESIPCVSGVRDADALHEGSHVRVDGWLGLVSVTAI